MPYLPSTAPSSSVTAEPMDLDAMTVAQDPCKAPPTVCCYNCNEFGHLARDCTKPQRRQTPATDTKYFRGQLRPMKPLHLFEDIEEEKGYVSDKEDEYVPEEFDPDEPDTEMQYLEANVMEEIIQEGELEEGEIQEDASDADDWRPVSPDNYYKVSPPFFTPLSVPNENPVVPLELLNVVSSGLPVYALEAGPPKISQSMNVGTFTPVRTIFDMGVESNYITARKAQVAGTQIYPITAREIVGAGRTVTNAFAAFTL